MNTHPQKTQTAIQAKVTASTGGGERTTFATKSIYDLGSLYGELQCEFNILPPTEGGHRTCIFNPLPGQILKSFSYSGYKDCKYHIHFFQPNIEKRTLQNIPRGKSF